MNKIVSAIITTHNRKTLLKRAIASVFSQTYSPIELIVVDDKSDDGTSDICHDTRINYIYVSKEESRGGNYARNLGIKAAKGVYCAFLDDDDYWLPTKIEKQVALIESKDCELVHCGRRLEFISNNKVIKYEDRLPRKSHYGDMHKKILLTYGTTTTTCIMAKRQALFDIGLFDEDLQFWQDYELTVRMAQRKPFYFVNEPLAVYRIDTQDGKRLTNKYFEWKKSVAYIYAKHKILYDKLNFIEKFYVKLLYCNDARYRCKASKLYIRYCLFSIVCFPGLFLYYIKKKLGKLF